MWLVLANFGTTTSPRKRGAARSCVECAGGGWGPVAVFDESHRVRPLSLHGVR